MKHLILTNDHSAAGCLGMTRLADLVIAIGLPFVWGKAPTDAKLQSYFARRKNRESESHWLDCAPQWRLELAGATHLGLIELCRKYDAIDLWIDPHINDQLHLICLLNQLRADREVAARLTLRQAKLKIAQHRPEQVKKWRLPAVEISNDHFELAHRTWQAFAAPTPRDWFDLLAGDLNPLPRLRHAVTEWLDELPGHTSGLGATQMRMLELIGRGGSTPVDVFSGDNKLNERRVFAYWEIGKLLDGLATAPAPAVGGLVGGPFTMKMHDDRARRTRYWESRLQLTPLGSAILRGDDDFSRHNRIRRWWGGTELTNDRLWRWDRSAQALIAP